MRTEMKENTDMNKSKFETVQKKLLGMKDSLIKESKAEIGHIVNVEDKYNGVLDDGDIADISYTDAMRAERFTRHQKRLQAIEDALRRIGDGTFGICEDCEEEIAVGRLNAMPFASRCVDCQERYELMNPEYEQVSAPAPSETESESEE